MAFNGPYDHTLNVPQQTVIKDNTPEYLEKLEKESGKSANAVQVELDEQERVASDEIMKDPQRLGDTDDVDETIQDMSYDKLLDMYQNGEKAGETDEVTYDELIGTPEEPFSEQQSFDMFGPEDQQLYDQVQADINKINAENPEEPEQDFAPLDMDELGEIADGEKDVEDDNGSGQHVDMPNDSDPAEPPVDMEPIEGFEF